MSRKGGKKPKERKAHKNKYAHLSKADKIKAQLDSRESQPKPEPTPLRPTYRSFGYTSERVYNQDIGRYEFRERRTW